MTTPALSAVSAASEYFADDEPVFGTGHELLEGRRVPLFGERKGMAGRLHPATQQPASDRAHADVPPGGCRHQPAAAGDGLRLAQPRPQGPAPPVGVPSAEPAEISTLRQTIWNIVDVITWGKEQNLPDDLGRWDPQDWQDFLDHQSAEATAAGLRHCIHAIRRMRKVAAVLTGITPFDDPWQGKAATHIANETAENAEERREGLATRRSRRRPGGRCCGPPGPTSTSSPLTCWTCGTAWPRIRRRARTEAEDKLPQPRRDRRADRGMAGPARQRCPGPPAGRSRKEPDPQG